MNTVTSKKLLHSKWTAVKIQNKEKHFIITEIEFDEEGNVIHCLIEAVMTKRSFPIKWQDLKNTRHWIIGWQ